MTKFTEKSFSVSGAGSAAYAEGWERAFGKSARTVAALEPTEESAPAGGPIDFPDLPPIGVEDMRPFTAHEVLVLAAIARHPEQHITSRRIGLGAQLVANCLTGVPMAYSDRVRNAAAAVRAWAFNHDAERGETED